MSEMTRLVCFKQGSVVYFYTHNAPEQIRGGIDLNAHSQDHLNVIQQLNSDMTRGLTEAQAAEKLAQYGENKLREKKKKTTFQRFLDQF